MNIIIIIIFFTFLCDSEPQSAYKPSPDATTLGSLQVPLSSAPTRKSHLTTHTSTSAPVSRAASPIRPSTYSSLNRPATPNIGASTSTHKHTRLPHPGPTYSTIHIMLNSNKSESFDDNPPLPSRSSGVDNKVAVVEEESEIQKALRTVNSYIPTSLSQVTKLGFLRGNGAAESESPPLKDKGRPKWLDKKRDVISKVRNLVSV